MNEQELREGLQLAIRRGSYDAALRGVHDTLTIPAQMEIELLVANARIAELEKDRDFHISKWREILKQEHSISDAYVRLRTILEAESPPDLHDPHALWAYVEEVAKAKVARIAELEALLGEAIESIEDWAGYASGYFREKHGLAEELEKYRRALDDST